VPNSALTVLHVDDDPALARLLERTLGRRGLAVENVPDIDLGLERIDRGGVDVVVLDHYLASGTGLDFLAKLAERQMPPPVVYVTASSDAMIAVDALKAGAADYVLKTVGSEFAILLASAIEQSHEKAQLKREKERAEAEIRAARDRAELLLTEVNHRVANSLALVAALVRMQTSAVSDQTAKDALAETQVRISAIAGLHRRLYTSDDVRSVALDEYLSALVSELDASMKAAGHSSRTRLDLERVTIAPDKAVSIGMIVTELITNAYKYAYPDGAQGEVRVRIKRRDDGVVMLAVEDDGIGWTGDGKPRGTGLGTRIVRSMASTLGTTIGYGDGAKGTQVTLELEL
jgi:two-component sensor histidine kinase